MTRTFLIWLRFLVSGVRARLTALLSPARTGLPVLLVLAIITGCAQGAQSNPSTAATAKPGKTYTNPVISSDFADPSILHVGKSYYAYATNTAGKNIQVASSPDLVHWDVLSDAMPALPAWAQPGGSYVWAPDVIQVGDTFVMYYTARDMQSNKQCVGVATSTKPTGKFHDRSDHPLVCQVDQGGTIDPSPFRDGDKLYLYFKNDGNCCAMTTYLYVQQLSADGLHVLGQPKPLVHNDKAWEGKVVEAPTMFKHHEHYYLFFSANDYAGVNYAVGYALCQSAVGPCEEAAENPVLASKVQSNPQVIGPGGQSLLQVDQQTWMVYHAWAVTPDGQQGDSRYMYLDRVNWQDDKPHIQGPTTNPQPLP